MLFGIFQVVKGYRNEELEECESNPPFVVMITTLTELGDRFLSTKTSSVISIECSMEVEESTVNRSRANTQGRSLSGQYLYCT